jgi:hypothetical protein
MHIMASTPNKTQPGKTSVKEFINSIENAQMRTDCNKLAAFMEKLSGEKPVMWGEAMVGFGNYHYKYESGREGDFFLIGFSPRKTNLTIYSNIYLNDDDPQLKALGKFKNGKSCIYVKKLEDIDLSVLEKLLKASMKKLREMYG